VLTLGRMHSAAASVLQTRAKCTSSDTIMCNDHWEMVSFPRIDTSLATAPRRSQSCTLFCSRPQRFATRTSEFENLLAALIPTISCGHPNLQT